MASSTSNNKAVRRDSHSSVLRALKLLNCGFISGLLQAGIFNPWDRALYLSVRYERPFIDRVNFQQPMAGVFQTLFQRAVSAGLYFPLEQLFQEKFMRFAKDHIQDIPANHQKYYPMYVNFLAGSMAGAMNGIIMNPFAAVKYHYWGKLECSEVNTLQTAVSMFRKGGIRPFMLGSVATVNRDLIFGAVFALIRHEVIRFYYHDKYPSKTGSVVINMLAGSIATILSSPLNYVRNIHYSIPPGHASQSTYQTLRALYKASLEEPSFMKQLLYLQGRLRIGWGTARVGCGMAFSATVYETCSRKFQNPHKR